MPTASRGTDKETEGGSSHHRWRDRRSVRTLRKGDSTAESDVLQKRDVRDNEETRLPVEESIHLGGVVLAETFTPSTITNLYRALEKMPGRDDRKKAQRISRVKVRRSGSGPGGWENLGCVRRPGESILGDGFTDAELPQGVNAVWLYLHYPIPSAAVLVATFTLEEKSADLSGALRADYRTQLRERRLRIYGRFSRVRAEIPWCRPKFYAVSHGIYGVDQQKKEACEERISGFERECWQWLTKNFRGRFATEDICDRPAMRILLTRSCQPFVERSRILAPVGLDRTLDVWTCAEFPGWMLNFSGWSLDERRRFGVIAAARRSDVEKVGHHGDSDDSIWYLTQEFHEYHSELMVRWSLKCLLSIYADRLGVLRDRAATRRRFEGSVRKALDLDDFLLGDGLDASTLASEMRKFTESSERFRRGVVEYDEFVDHPSSGIKSGVSKEGPRYLSMLPRALAGRLTKSDKIDSSSSRPSRVRGELAPVLCKALNGQSVQLLSDMNATIENIRASAELRQAIANTKLQRWVVFLAVIATTASVVGVLISTLWS